MERAATQLTAISKARFSKRLATPCFWKYWAPLSAMLAREEGVARQSAFAVEPSLEQTVLEIDVQTRDDLEDYICSCVAMCLKIYPSSKAGRLQIANRGVHHVPRSVMGGQAAPWRSLIRSTVQAGEPRWWSSGVQMVASGVESFGPGRSSKPWQAVQPSDLHPKPGVQQYQRARGVSLVSPSTSDSSAPRYTPPICRLVPVIRLLLLPATAPRSVRGLTATPCLARPRAKAAHDARMHVSRVEFARSSVTAFALRVGYA